MMRGKEDDSILGRRDRLTCACALHAVGEDEEGQYFGQASRILRACHSDPISLRERLLDGIGYTRTIHR